MNAKNLTLLCIVSLITSCGIMPKHNVNHELHIDELIIRNTTETEVMDIELRVIDTRVRIACSIILPRSMCSLGFQKIPLEEHETRLSWKQNKVTYSEIVKSRSIPSIPDAKVYINILDKGKLNVSVK